MCRPVASGGAVCEPSETAGRIPSCIDSQGIDVFAVEANSALSVTWNVNASLDLAGGFEVAYGATSKQYGATCASGRTCARPRWRPCPMGRRTSW